MRRIAYLGPEATFTHAAAILWDPEAKHLPQKNFTAVAAAVRQGEAEEGLIAVENTLGGAVAETAKLLFAENDLFVRGEVLLPVQQDFFVKPGARLEGIKRVRSHEQGLLQCKGWLSLHLPNAILESMASTAGAVQSLAESDDTVAAIGPSLAGKLYGAQALACGIQDHKANATRFLVLAREDWAAWTGNDKTMIRFSFGEKDRAGQLAAALNLFAHAGINLFRIESGPTGKELGEYLFLIEVAGHRKDPQLENVLAQLQKLTGLDENGKSRLVVLGSYRRWRKQA